MDQDLSSTPSASRDNHILTHETSSNDGSKDTGDNDAVSIQADTRPVGSQFMADYARVADRLTYSCRQNGKESER